jgi:uncharacterized protein DUF3631
VPNLLGCRSVSELSAVCFPDSCELSRLSTRPFQRDLSVQGMWRLWRQQPTQSRASASNFSPISTVFGDTEVLATETILEPLHALEESPWVDLRGKPLNARGLSNRLGKYELRPKSVRLDGGHLGLVPAMTVSMSPRGERRAL